MPAQKEKNTGSRRIVKVENTESASTAIDIPLPGGVIAEDSLIEKAVGDLNVLYTKHGLETAVAIGEYLLQTFFDGDVDNYNEYGRKHATFKALAERDDLQFSTSYLAYAIPVCEQVKFLATNGITENLPLSHHRMLVAVRDEKKKIQLAEKAIQKSLSKRAFEAEVIKYRSTREATSSGRPPLPAFAKGFTKLLQAINLSVSEEVTEDSFEHFDLSKAKDLIAQVDDGLTQLQSLRKNLVSQVGKLEKANR